MIDIMKEIVKLREDAVLLCFGEGGMQEQIQEKVRALSLEKHVRFMGSVTDMQKYYNAFDVFLLPSLYEGLSVSLVEAQCNGVVVISSDTVTDEIRLSERYQMVGLTEEAQKWAEIVCSYAKEKETISPERRTAYTLIEKEGYSIACEAAKLDAFYKEVVR